LEGAAFAEGVVALVVDAGAADSLGLGVAGFAGVLGAATAVLAAAAGDGATCLLAFAAALSCATVVCGLAGVTAWS